MRRPRAYKKGSNLSSLISGILLLLASLPLSNPLSITTFNMLAPVHRSMDAMNTRESERDEWWRPRAEFLAEYVSTSFRNSDVVLLQEWWFRPEFEQVFDFHTSPLFHRVAERRPGDGREDGMAVLIKKQGELEIVESLPVLTGPQRIAQLVNCRHAHDDRHVSIANVHLSFPSSPDALVNERRQACEVQKVACALSQQQRLQRPTCFNNENSRLEVLGGDFNSNSGALAAQSIELQHDFVNCASAAAEQALSHTGGQVGLGITHKQHDGLLVSVDHIFARMVPQCNKESSKLLRRYGYLDAAGTRVVDCCRGDLELECPSQFLLSDHRPVTATFEWPSGKVKRPLFNLVDFCNTPLDPLEPPSYLGGTNITALVGVTSYF